MFLYYLVFDLVLINLHQKENLTLQWTKGTFENWITLFDSGRNLALINTILLAFIVSFLVVSISIVTVYAMYKQKNKLMKTTLNNF
ncbi:hypothetical protein NWE60_03820 [Mycoplasmopsis felis]|nr:hypothetical protein [Mycoplasmopsis felis]WAM00609.1 hypothetical protein NWE60_03820 [Mycoplasmopsis felis]